jgi:hypothetical protein
MILSLSFWVSLLTVPCLGRIIVRNSRLNWARLIMLLDPWGLSCLMNRWGWFTIPIFIQLCHMGKFWGNSAHSINIFKLQKKIIRIITNSRNKDSGRHLFMKLDISPFYSEYLFSLLIFVIDNISLFKTNSKLYEINTININNFHLSQPRWL